MKQLNKIILILQFLLISLSSFSQQYSQDSISLKSANDAFKNSSASEKETFGGYISGFGDIISASSGAINLSGTLYGIGRVFAGRKDTLDYNYLHHSLLTNTQFNIGVTPNNKNNFQFDKGAAGITYAIINNKKASQAIYNSLITQINQSHQLTDDMKETQLDNALITNPNRVYIGKLFTLYLSTKDSSLLSEPDRLLILNSLGVTSLKQISAPLHLLYEMFSNDVSKQLLFTASANANYNFNKSSIDVITFSLIGSKALYADNQKGKQFSIQVSPAFNIANDTLEKSNNVDRHFFKGELQVIYKLSKNFEIDIPIDFIHVLQGIYPKEDKNQIQVSLTPRIRINKNFWLPISILYKSFDKHPQFLGFVSVQYSLK